MPPRNATRRRWYSYEFRDGREVALSGPHPLLTLISIDDYLRACVGQYRLSTRRADRLEQAVHDTLRPALEENPTRLGTYARRFLIGKKPLIGNNVGLASDHNITAVSLSSRGDTLDEEDEALLRSTILRGLGGGDGSN